MSSVQSPVVLAFDLYGTLLSTSSIAEELAKHLGKETASAVATTWRTLQLEYTWRLNSMHKFIPFSLVNSRSLSNALRTHDASLTPEARDAVLAAYDSLDTFPDVGPALKRLEQQQQFQPYVFSNGTAEMVGASVHRSPSLGPHAHIFQDIITVEAAGVFKPEPAAYELLARRAQRKGREAEVWLVSGNPFDVVGARGAGMQAAWVDRDGKGWADQLLGDGEEGRPTVVAQGLGDVVAKVEEWLEKQNR